MGGSSGRGGDIGVGLALVGGEGVGVVWVKNGYSGRRRKEICRLGRRWRWKFSLAKNLKKRENIGVGMRKVSVALVVGVGVVSTCLGEERVYWQEEEGDLSSCQCEEGEVEVPWEELQEEEEYWLWHETSFQRRLSEHLV